MRNIKHIGRVANTDVKCVVVFRQLYDDKGKVVDPDHCLVVETERLPDAEHDEVIRVVESVQGQDAAQFYEVAHRNKFGDGTNMLVALHQRGRLRKYPTNQIVLTPNGQSMIKLSEVNEIIRKQESGMNESEIKNTMVDDTDSAPRTQTSFDSTQTIDQAIDTAEAVLDDTAIAQNLIAQADTFLAEAKRLQDEAYAIAPALKKKVAAAKKPAAKKAPAKKPAKKAASTKKSASNANT